MAGNTETKSVEESSKVVPLANPQTQPPETLPKQTSPLSRKMLSAFSNDKKPAVKLSIGQITFLLLVLIPTIASAIYMWGFAKNQFMAKASFVVRSNTSATPSDMLGILTQGSGESTTADSYIIIDYLASETFVKEMRQRFDLGQIYGRGPADWYFSLSAASNIQDATDFWSRMHDIHFDAASGMLTLEVRAFTPEHASILSAFALQESNLLIERMSQQAREDQVKFAKREVALAELRLKDMRRKLNKFRVETGILDPQLAVTNALTVIGELQNQRIAIENERVTLLANLSPDAPSIQRLENKLAALEEQIKTQKSAIDGTTNQDKEGSDTTLSQKIGDYEEIAVEKEFAEAAYTTALAALEQARVKASNTQKYLSIIQKPEPLERSDHPNRPLLVILVGLIGFAIWSVINLLIANMRTRR